MAGRFAPSPTSDLHIGNLRTALCAWLWARSTSRQFWVRIEDLDTQRVAAAPLVARQQLADLDALGVDFDGAPVWQSTRSDRYSQVIASLGDDVYECYCTRREISEAASAPHTDGFRPYPGTCAHLCDRERAERRKLRPPALRVRAHGAVQQVHDFFAGTIEAVVDDFVLVRNDGVPAYNLAVVVDDVEQGVDQVVRGDDLLSSSPRQGWLARRLGSVPPHYVHVPLVLNQDGTRLAKRDGAVSLGDLARHGVTAPQVLSAIAVSLGLADPGEPVNTHQLLERFDPTAIPTTPWQIYAKSLLDLP